MNDQSEQKENRTEEEKSAGQDTSAEGNRNPTGNDVSADGNGILTESVSAKESGILSGEPVPAGEVDARISSYVKEHIRNDGRQRKLSAFRVLFFVVLFTIVVFFFVDYVLMKRQVVNGWFAQNSRTDEDESGKEDSEDGESGNTLTEDDPAQGDGTDPDGENSEESQGAAAGETQDSAGTDENNNEEKTDPGENSVGAGTSQGGNQSEISPDEEETAADPVEIALQYLVYIKVTDSENAASVQADNTGASDLGADGAENIHETAGVIVEIGQSAVRILTDYASVEYAETIEITLNGGEKVPAQVETVNLNTGLALLAVSVEELSNETLKEIRMATWGDTAEITAGTTLLLATAANPATDNSTISKVGDSTTLAGGTSVETEEADTGKTPEDDTETMVLLTEIAILSVSEKKQPDAVFTTYSFYADAEGCRILIDENGDIAAISTGVADSISGNTQNTDGAETAVAYCADDLKGYIEKMVDGEEIPYIGITGVAVTDEIKESVSLDMPYGIYVWLADTGSPAYQAGILNGDIITAINGVEITTLQEMRDAILGLEVGVEASFTLMRQGGSTYREYTIEVTPVAVETVINLEPLN